MLFGLGISQGFRSSVSWRNRPGGAGEVRSGPRNLTHPKAGHPPNPESRAAREVGTSPSIPNLPLLKGALPLGCPHYFRVGSSRRGCEQGVVSNAYLLCRLPEMQLLRHVQAAGSLEAVAPSPLCVSVEAHLTALGWPRGSGFLQSPGQGTDPVETLLVLYQEASRWNRLWGCPGGALVRNSA